MISIIYHAREQELLVQLGTQSTIYTPSSSSKKKGNNNNDVKNK